MGQPCPHLPTSSRILSRALVTLVFNVCLCVLEQRTTQVWWPQEPLQHASLWWMLRAGLDMDIPQATAETLGEVSLNL